MCNMWVVVCELLDVFFASGVVQLTGIGRQSLDAAPNGKILIGLNFISGEQSLVVKIFNATGLPAMDTNGFSDPYVKWYVAL